MHNVHSINERCAIAFANPCATAQQTLDRRFWKRLCVEGRWLSTIVTVNK